MHPERTCRKSKCKATWTVILLLIGLRSSKTLVGMVKAELSHDLLDWVLQVQADFNDSIEVARRNVFPKARPANDYPHMMRATQATLTKKTTEEWRQRVLQMLRCTRHLPTTLELFSNVWWLFSQEFRANELSLSCNICRRNASERFLRTPCLACMVFEHPQHAQIHSLVGLLGWNLGDSSWECNRHTNVRSLS